ncbi:LapA family protein [Chitinispirillales bacterium ANBcel5]|uniref:LapA family protein n=1 Tax=Cellulosispirillum alkaliphilum TaxID=3039283 RepID=UPI002A586705|nr:LapA family protein [Chitinispirillales bacterium ANBcel5]
MKKTKIVILWIISLLLLLFIVQNTAQVRARFFWFTADVPVIVLLVFAATGGFICGILVALAIESRATESKQ